VLTVDHRPRRWLWIQRDHGRLLSNGDVRALARLAMRAGRVFGGPQDIEWVFHPDGSLSLLQSQPVTAIGMAAHAAGPVLGPGPVVETFPDPLSPLETDLWVSPLHGAMVAALSETRAVARGRLDSSPVITTVRGRVAVDLGLFGYEDSCRVWTLLDPRPSVRRLAASWHVGMVRAVLPSRAEALVREVDHRLASITLRDCTEDQLLDLLDDCVAMLERLQHDEVLAATLLPPVTRTAAAAALDVLVRPRCGGQGPPPGRRRADRGPGTGLPAEEGRRHRTPRAGRGHRDHVDGLARHLTRTFALLELGQVDVADVFMLEQAVHPAAATSATLSVTARAVTQWRQAPRRRW
jgi:rifampicin phosphotransferase